MWKRPYSDKWEGHPKISYYIKKPHKSYYLSNALKTSYSFDSFSKSYKNRNVELMILPSKNNVTWLRKYLLHYFTSWFKSYLLLVYITSVSKVSTPNLRWLRSVFLKINTSIFQPVFLFPFHFLHYEQHTVNSSCWQNYGKY